jgi:hypothetical protein
MMHHGSGGRQAGFVASLPRLYHRSKLRWSGANEPAEHACKVARILKPGVHSRFEYAGFGVSQILFCPLNSLQEYVSIGSLSGAPSEHLDKSVRAHSGDRSEFAKAEIARNVVTDIVEHAIETACRQTASVADWRRLPHSIAIEQIDRQ